MIIKGGPRGKGAQLAVHLMRTDTNETVNVFGRRGVYSKTVRGALQEMEAIAAGSKATRPLYHVSINPESDEILTPAQWQEAADRLEKALGLEGHQRVMVQHLKQGKAGDMRQHMHVVWCRIDVNTMKAAHHSHNYRTHEEVARDLEREFGLKRTQGVHAERDGGEKPEKRPNTKESMQEAVTGWKKEDAKAMIAAAWNAGGNGAAFMAYLEKGGYRLAAGDKRDFVVIDPAGGVHSIRSGVRGLKVADVRERFGDLDLKRLPSAGDAQQAARDSYPAFLAVRKARRAPPEPVRSVRPPRPQPDRYETLRQTPSAPPAPVARPSIASTQPVKFVRAPQVHYVPKAPSWATETGSVTPKPAAQPVLTPQKAPAHVSPPPVISEAAQDLRARQETQWRETLAGLTNRHARAIQALDRHHAERMAGLTTDVDERLRDLNGIASRGGALFDKAAHDREIAYLVAKRQRSLADEKARQEAVKDDLRRAQEREIAEAKAKHDRLAAIQQQVQDDAEKRRQDQAKQNAATPTLRRPPDLER